MSKYENTKAWLAPVRLYDEEFAAAIEDIHLAVCLADDIADRKVYPGEVSHSLWAAFNGVGYFVKHPEKWPRILESVKKIYDSEIANQTFIPGALPLEQDLDLWIKRSSLLDLYFSAWCVADPSFDTVKNWKWFEEFKKYVLILDDCCDIEDGTFEDLHQCKRNFVVLTKLGASGYFGFQERIEELKCAAKEVRESLKLMNPEDLRMKAFMRG